MAEVEFNGIKFDDEIYGAYVESLPHMRTNALLRSGAIVSSKRLETMFKSSTGSFSTRIPMMGRIGGKPVNYDGKTDIPYDGINSLSQRITSFGRAKAWGANQFTIDITNGVDPKTWMGRQVAEWWDDVNMDLFTAVINGMFGMTDTASEEFVVKHTYDITGEDSLDKEVTSETLNNAVQKASGQWKGIYKTIIMNSAVATNLENLSLLKYKQGTDPNGLQSDLTLATWNGRTVLIDDHNTFDPETGKYTSFLLGGGAFYFGELGAQHAVEVHRKPLEQGGIDIFINRRRGYVIPHGISFIGEPASFSPTDEELLVGTNWEIVQNKETGEKYPHQLIPFARIISEG